MAKQATTPPPTGEPPAPARAMTSAAGGARGYKRSWKNLLINKKYQLQFTLFMVGVSTLLMVGLGYWVMRVADNTTTVAVNSVLGQPCGDPPALNDSINGSGTSSDAGAIAPAAAPATAAAPAPAPEPAAADAPVADAPAADAPAEPAPDGDRPRRRPVVEMGETTMTVTAVAPPDFVQRVVEFHTCQLAQAGTIDDLERGRTHILIVLIVSGLVLIFGLAIYGIKMTHKVAGPLFKVSLYLAKMKDGRLDKVWNLRKGDQLIEFYEHFKEGHAGVVALQKADIEQLRAVLAAAEQGGWAQRSPEVATALEDLATLVAKKEKSLE